RLVLNHLADVVGDVIGIGAWRLVALVAPGLVSRDRLAADKLQRLGARLITQRLALQMPRNGENLQAMFPGQIDALPGVCLRPGICPAATDIAPRSEEHTSELQS